MKRKNLLLKGFVLIFLSTFIVFVFISKPGSLLPSFAGNGKNNHEKATSPVEERYRETLLNSYEFDPKWYPNSSEKFGTDTQPEIAGESALLIEIDSDKVLYEKNSTKRLKIASLTKIMTAVVALEHAKLDSKISISAKAANIGENVMGVSEGEIYTLRELLYGLVLNSGNDAAYAIAEGVSGNSDAFIEWMNIKAKELGLNDTKFTDPSGLDDDTYSSTQDLVKLTKYAMKNPDFREVIATKEIELASDTHKYLYLINQTNLLTTYPGVAGVKTGFTEEAGLCLVTYAKNDGKEVIGVVLNSVDRKGDMVLMLDHGFATLGVTIKHPALAF